MKPPKTRAGPGKDRIPWQTRPRESHPAGICLRTESVTIVETKALEATQVAHSVWTTVAYVQMVVAHLIEPGEGVVFALLGCSPPVEEHSSILAGWVSEWHPLPGPYLLGAQLGLHCAVALTSVTG